jgi:CO dehydrogenase/acetyl-CoA synthase beta subunit
VTIQYNDFNSKTTTNDTPLSLLLKSTTRDLDTIIHLVAHGANPAVLKIIEEAEKEEKEKERPKEKSKEKPKEKEKSFDYTQIKIQRGKAKAKYRAVLTDNLLLNEEVIGSLLVGVHFDGMSA